MLKYSHFLMSIFSAHTLAEKRAAPNPQLPPEKSATGSESR